MPAIIDDWWCEACHKVHTLYFPASDYLAPNQEYEYKCPAAEKTVRFALPDLKHHRIDSARPQGSVRILPVVK